MPLEILNARDPMRDDIALQFVLQAVDGETSVTIEVSFDALRAKGAQDGLRKDMHTEDLFHRYRVRIALLASENYDAGKWAVAGRHRVLAVDAITQ
jgi:hypothetical protein